MYVLLIITGVAGVGLFVSQSKILLNFATYGGALFLVIYALRLFISALNPSIFNLHSNMEKISLKKTISLVLAVTLLNPQAYLDTIILLGSIGGQLPIAKRTSFTIGASLASFCWTFLLAYGASFLSPLFTKPATWRFLDFSIGCILLFLAASFIF